MKSFLIGSLPFLSKNDALKFLQKFDIPTLVTLPNIDESEFMLHHSFKDLMHFNFQRNRVHKLDSKGTALPFSFLIEDEFFQEDFSEYKWQCTGPVSMIETMEMHEYDQLMLNDYLDKVILTQTKFNKLTSARPFFFVDEPMLGTSGDLRPVLLDFINNLKSHPAFKEVVFGLHCCSKIEFELSDMPFDLFSLDYQLYSKKEWSYLQSQLKDKLVAINWDSDFNPIQYPKSNEKFQSTSCGQALCKRDLLKVV